MRVSLWSVAVAVAVAGSTAGLHPPLAGAADKPVPKDIDVVVCLDVSNSMDGLIDSAKLKLWDIVNEFAKVKPTPNLRVALYSYGHTQYPAEKGWVRKDQDLTTDLDTIYAKLNGLTTGGGEEYVARVTNAALLDQPWSKRDGAMKVIFVCGNEAATQDRELHLEGVAGTATKFGVLVNTIYCGPANNAESRDWAKFAKMAGGKSATIDQHKARRAADIATPFDKELAEASGKLNGTYLAFGAAGKDGAARQQAQDKKAEESAAGAAAARGAAKASGLYKNAAWDLIDRMQDDPKFDLKTVKEEDLPEEMKKLTPDERVALLKKKQTERGEIKKQIEDLAAKRSKHLDEEAKKVPKTAGEQALDEALRTIIREQAAAKGIDIPAK